MKKFIAFVATVVFAFPIAALASNEKVLCYTTFYKTKNIACVDELADVISKAPPHIQPDADLQAIVGFLAQIFIDYPQLKERILHQEATDRAKSIYLSALYRADLRDEAKEYADKSGEKDKFNQYQSNNVQPLKNRHW